MECKVNNISLKKITIDTKIEKYKKLINDHLKKYKEENSEYPFKNANELLPNFIPEEFTFELKNCTSEIANLIRRVIINNVPVYSLYVDLEKYKCNDLHFLIDDFKLKLEAIPINQKLAEKLYKEQNYKINLLKLNTNLTQRIKIFAKDLTIKDRNNKKIDINKFLSPTIILMGSSSFVLSPETKECIGQFYEFFRIAMMNQINEQRDKKININQYLSIHNPDNINTNCKELADYLNLKRIPDRFHTFAVKELEIGLLPSKLLEVTDIKIVRGTGKNNINSFSSVSRTIYKILDQTFLYDEITGKENKNGISSLNFNPNHFKIGYRTYGNIEPKKIINYAINYIIEQIYSINKELKQINKLPYYGNNINLIKNINIFTLEINNH